MENIEALQKFGLSEKESKVYLANLELGEATANDISLKSNLPRTLIYDILERLIDLGLVSYSIKNSKKFFLASDPNELVRIIKEKENSVSLIMPSLEQIYKTKGLKRPKVEIYEGKEGMKTMMNEIIRSGVKEFYSYGSSRSSYEIIPAFIVEWHKERIKRKVKIKIIYNNTKQAKERIKSIPQTMKLMEYRFMPIELESPTAIMVYQNKVALELWTKEPFAVVIESEQMAENQKRYFEELWKIAKKA
ncbi:MAG: helix-turn-helix domain-containing protein [Candidatus Pacearchaeota archaeon]|jgi:sugar-specific transcriptional regulator TrmB